MIGGKVAISIIPSGTANTPLDNIIAVANAAALPASTTEGRILYYTQDTRSWYFWNGTAWVLILDDGDHAALLQVISDLAAHIADATDAHDASAISSVASGNLAATDVQGALDELQSNIDALQAEQDADETALADHLADAVDAHDASAVSVVASGSLTSTDVQSALEELQTDIDTINNRGWTVQANAAQANGATLTPSGNPKEIIRVSGSGGAVTLADLGIANSTQGDEIIIMGTDDTNTVTLVSATNTALNGSCTLANRDSITLVHIDSVWVEVSRSA